MNLSGRNSRLIEAFETGRIVLEICKESLEANAYFQGNFFMDKNIPFMDKTAGRCFLRYAVIIA